MNNCRSRTDVATKFREKHLGAWIQRAVTINFKSRVIICLAIPVALLFSISDPNSLFMARKLTN